MRAIVFVTTSFLLWRHSKTQQNCDDAPNANARQVCLSLQSMDANARREFQRQADNNIWPPAIPGLGVPTPVDPNTRGQVAWHPYDCMTLACLCPFFGGGLDPQGTCLLRNGQPLGMAIRKEYRQMTDNERNRWHSALQELKRNGEYDRISWEHRQVGQGSGAHSGPGFLPWHREYVKRLEIALRLLDPGVAIPYWDSVIDNYLNDPRDSIMFSPLFAGETDGWGNLVTGPFAFFSTLDGRSTPQRFLGNEGQLFTEQQLNAVYQQTNIEYVLAYTAPQQGCPFPNNFQALEYTHSNIHLWLGGDMKPPATSSHDPIFFMHHSFVDLIWENWRLLRQPRWAYSPDMWPCTNPMHFSYAQMVPYNLINRDGLSNAYTDQLYRYAPRPTCSYQEPTCYSPYLFCDLRGFPHCVAKVKMNGWCGGYEGLDSCYQGQCWFGRCVPGPTPAPWTRPTQAPPTTPRPVAPRTAAPFVDCYNRNPCCTTWASIGECDKNARYMNEWCRVACNRCKPAFNISNECANRHVSCEIWQREGQCTGRSAQFMAENCRQSCGMCDSPKAAVCGPRSLAASKAGNSTRRSPSSTTPAPRGSSTPRRRQRLREQAEAPELSESIESREVAPSPPIATTTGRVHNRHHNHNVSEAARSRNAKAIRRARVRQSSRSSMAGEHTLHVLDSEVPSTTESPETTLLTSTAKVQHNHNVTDAQEQTNSNAIHKPQDRKASISSMAGDQTRHVLDSADTVSNR